MPLNMDCHPLDQSSNAVAVATRKPATSCWKAGPVSWARVLRQQDLGALLSTVVVCVALLVAQVALADYRERPFMVTDATISFPHDPASSVPYWVAIVASVLAMALSVLLAELWLARFLHADASDALAAALHFLIDAISAFLVTGLATTVSKKVVGRLRPDFLSRCQPVIPSPLDIKYGQPTSVNPECKAPESGELTDGHWSFPSGHTSTVFVFSVWTAAYCIWAFYMRQPNKANSMPRRSVWERLLRDLSTATGFTWILVVLGYAWAVGVSRITDFKHHPSDVVGGAFLGALVGIAFVVRAIARAGAVAGAAVPLPAGDAGGDVGGDATPDPFLLNNHQVHPDSDDMV